MVQLEINCIVACIVFTSSIIADAVLASDPPFHNETPTSMRASSIILVACLASPPIRQQYVFVQRFVIGIGLAAVALAGDHTGSRGVRIADVIFTFLMASMTLSAYMQGGTESLKPSTKSRTSTAPEFTKRETVCALAIALLFYSSCRVIRQCISYASNVEAFQIQILDWNGTSVTVPGYAHMNVASIIALGFGGMVGATVSTLLLSSTSLREVGTGAKRDIMLIGGLLQFMAAFWATVALSDQQEELPILFSASGCTSESCPASGIARRFAMTNGSPSPLWVNSLGLFVLAYGPDSKKEDKRNTSALLSPIVVVWGLLSFVGCVCVVFAYSSFQGSGIYVEISTLICLAGVTVTAFWNTELGCMIFSIGIGYDEITSVIDNSLLVILTYLTHCSILVGVVALILRTLLVIVVDLGWRFFGPRITDVLDDIVGVLTIAGTSIFTFLYLATNSLVSTYEGIFLGPESYERGPNVYARSLVAAVLEHWLPILIFLPMYRSKQVVNLAFGWKLGVWIGTLVVALAVWTTALFMAGRDADHADIYEWSNQYPFMASVIVACIVPWLSISLV